MYRNQNEDKDTIVYDKDVHVTNNYTLIDRISIDTNYITNGKLYYKNLYKDSNLGKRDFIYVYSKVEITPIINQETIETGIDEVSDEFGIVDGFITSDGKIVVYNVKGQIVTTAIETLDINTLSNGVYIIKANEGTIKFIK